MKRIIATILIGLLVAPPASAGQKPGKPTDWRKAQSLKAGTQIVLTLAGGEPTKVHLLCADDTNLVTLTPTPKLPGRVGQLLLKVGAEGPAVARRTASYGKELVRVSKEGIFERDQKLCGLADVVLLTSRGDVEDLANPGGHGGLVGRLVVGGVLLVVSVGLSLAAAGD